MADDRNAGGMNVVDVLDRVLDKGIVIDAAVRVSLVGVELLGVDARVVVASIQTYLRHADQLAYTAMAAHPQPQRHEPPLFAEPTAEMPADPSLLTATPVEPAEPAAEDAERGADDARDHVEGDLSTRPPDTGL